ncbi:MAG: glycosyltransferase family 39 protein [Syntrophobacterales bacterium]|jgi:4-amino-4-deoxy-L-arabinose transferase-like glycosyltransferase|nr:glycosyltransferase family 39 protein [Syntrophobacterales bacterium]
MKTEQPNSLIAPIRPWSSRDWVFFILVAMAGAILLLSGLSVRSLWGSEGRWAVIVREMLSTGNYFLPTINGEVYFDKPLLSYWIIALFASPGGVTEAVSRLPSAFAGVAAVLVTFSIGRRLFDTRTAVLSGGLLLTSIMYILWSKTASAELLNVLSIWLMLWAFVTGGVDGKLTKLILLYCFGAVSAFLKGPVAPAVGFSVIGFYSLVMLLTPFATRKPSFQNVPRAFLIHFKWIISWQGLISILASLLLFAALLLAPVIITGSWQSVELMWRENFLRFFRPFDHVEPPYVYLKYTLLFFLPWTLLLIGALWHAKEWLANRANWWTPLAGLAIFLFFTASGSRRSYYILPLVPALALITGKALTDWLARPVQDSSRTMNAAALATAALPSLAGMALLCSYFIKEMPHHLAQILVGILAIIGSLSAIFLLKKRRRLHGLILLFLLVFGVELWSFTGGMAAMEEMRTFRVFCREAAAELKGIPDSRLALFPGGDSSLIFYLNRGRLRTLGGVEDVAKFRKEFPDGFIISESKMVQSLLRENPAFQDLVTVLAQVKEPRSKKEKRLLLMRFAAK